MLYGEYRLEDEIAVVKKEVREEAWEEAWEDGREKGREENTLEVARNLLAEGSTHEFVQKITGLDMETIKTLKN